MATAEHLLHEARYAFLNISYGESRENTRSAARAKSLCKKIIRKFPASKEAMQAHTILRQLGDKAYSSAINSQHSHRPQVSHHKPQSSIGQSQPPATYRGDVEAFNWGRLVAWLFNLPKTTIVIIAITGLFLLTLFGPFLFILLFAFVFLTGPFRKTLKPTQRRNLNAFVVRANEFFAQQEG